MSSMGRSARAPKSSVLTTSLMPPAATDARASTLPSVAAAELSAAMRRVAVAGPPLVRFTKPDTALPRARRSSPPDFAYLVKSERGLV